MSGPCRTLRSWADGAMALPEPVERVGWYRFGASPADPTGAPRLVLVTCGGPFDEAARSYEGNILVTAVPE